MNGFASRLLPSALDVVHLLALVLWSAALLSVAVAAMGVFITLPKSNVVLPEFSGYVEATNSSEAAAAADYGRIAGGLVMAPVFARTDQAQAILGSIAFATFVVRSLLRSRWRSRRLGTFLQGALITAALVLVAWHNARVAPRMDQALQSFWEHARAGEIAEATAARARFDADHHGADFLFRVRFALVLGALVVSAVSGGAARTPAPGAEPRP